MVEKKKTTKISKESKNTFTPSLSSEDVELKILDALNNIELQKGIDFWLKNNNNKNNLNNRDLNMLASIIQEYLECFVIFGYNLEGERVLIQSYGKAKDRDAIMEFLKIVFFKLNHPEDLHD
jgi:hypothetical protein